MKVKDLIKMLQLVEDKEARVVLSTMKSLRSEVIPRDITLVCKTRTQVFSHERPITYIELADNHLSINTRSGVSIVEIYRDKA